MDERLKNEINHAKFLLEKGAGEIWNWETSAGKLRWRRRVEMLCFALKPEYKVLEIGCGTGYFTKELVKTGADITAIDISPDLIEEAMKNTKAENVFFRVDNAYNMGFQDDFFDVVLGSSVLHHLDIDKAIKEIYRVLKKGGAIYFTEPNMMNPQIALQKNIPYLKRKLGDSPDETAFFRWCIRKKLIETGFVEVTVKPFDFLHPQTPKSLIKTINQISFFVEKTPLVSELAGSLYIVANK